MMENSPSQGERKKLSPNNSILFVLAILVCQYYNGGAQLLLQSFLVVLVTLWRVREDSSLEFLRSIPSLAVLTAVPLFGIVALTVTIWLSKDKHVSIVSRNGDVIRLEQHSSTYTSRAVDYLNDTTVKAGMLVFSPAFELMFIGKPDLNKPSLDSYAGIVNFAALGKVTHRLNHKNIAFYLVLILMATVPFFGGLGFLVALVSLATMVIPKPPISREQLLDSAKRAYRNLSSEKADIQDGVYRIVRNLFGVDHHMGIAYAESGVLYTRYHVTYSAPLVTPDGAVIRPSYANAVSDRISYGGAPKFYTPKDGQEATVVVAGPYTSALLYYRTRVHINEEGIVVFRGSANISGASGSPVFVTEENEYVDDAGVVSMRRAVRFVGNVGWHLCRDPDNLNNPVIGTEFLFPEPGAIETNFYPMIPGRYTQVFKHPGSGKTRTIVPGIIRQATNECMRTYISGPTRAVCRELYQKVSQEFPDRCSLMISEATPIERAGQDIIVTAHATMLSLLLTNKINPRGRACFIIDEAHYSDTRSMCLKDYLRYSVKAGRRGCLIEMTATGYDVRAKQYVFEGGSNHPITEVRMSPDAMIDDMVAKAKEKKKVLAFVPSIKGRGMDSGDSISSYAISQGIKTLILRRSTFTVNYPKAMRLSHGLILTTDVSECGANISPDYVYDFQEGMKMVYRENCVTLTKRKIDEGQRIQRRGRAGRLKQGYYVSPGYVDLPLVDMERVEHMDRKIFNESLGIDSEDPGSGHPVPFKLTTEQVRFWMHYDTKEYSTSPWKVRMVTYESGRAKHPDHLQEAILKWSSTETVQVMVGGKEMSLEFWDERDRQSLEDMLRSVGKTDVGHFKPISSISRRMMRTAYQTLFSVSRPKEPPEEDAETEEDGFHDPREIYFAPPCDTPLA